MAARARMTDWMNFIVEIVDCTVLLKGFCERNAIEAPALVDFALFGLRTYATTDRDARWPL